jgi:hypothetical protein
MSPDLDIQQMIAAIQASFADAFAEQQKKSEQQHQELREEVSSLRSEIETIRTKSATTPVVLLTPPEPYHQPATDETKLYAPGSSNANSKTIPMVTTKHEKSTKLPDPSMFSGKRSELVPFRILMRNKLRTNHDHYPSEDEQLGYVLSRIGGDAARLVDSFNPPSVDDVFGLLEVSYGDPNVQITAQAKLNKMSQGDRNFPTYFSEFHRYAKQSGWNDSALVNRLLESLNGDLQNAMITLDRPDTLVDCAHTIQKIYNNMTLLKRPLYKGAQHSGPKDPYAMDLDKLSSEERDRCRKHGLCFNCKKHGHLTRDCKEPRQRSRSNSQRRGRNRNRSQTKDENIATIKGQYDSSSYQSSHNSRRSFSQTSSRTQSSRRSKDQSRA